MTREEAHRILDKCLDEAEQKKLYGRTAFVLHFVNGNLLQITDTNHDSERTITRTSVGRRKKDGK